METARRSSPRLTARQHQILNQWRAISGDIRELCESLGAMPDECTCSDGRAHLAGSCPCCERVPVDGTPQCANCNALLATLRPPIDALTVETYQFFPQVLEFLDLHRRRTGNAARGAREQYVMAVTGQEAAGAVEHHLAGVIRTFGRLVLASEEFRAGCRLSHLQALKAAATELLTEVERLDQSA